MRRRSDAINNTTTELLLRRKHLRRFEFYLRVLLLRDGNTICSALNDCFGRSCCGEMDWNEKWETKRNNTTSCFWGRQIFVILYFIWGDGRCMGVRLLSEGWIGRLEWGHNDQATSTTSCSWGNILAFFNFEGMSNYCRRTMPPMEDRYMILTKESSWTSKWSRARASRWYAPHNRRTL